MVIGLTINQLKKVLHDGIVIPAHPLALNEARILDVRRQKALTKYYIESGAGGIAVGVHTTQFEIRSNEHNLYRKVLKAAVEVVEQYQMDRPFVKVAGICGELHQALEEAHTAKELGYDIALVSMGGLGHHSEKELIQQVEKVSKVMPIFGFYLQPSVGGRILSYNFWKDLANIPEVLAIKVAPFNRYQTLDVMRAVCYSDRREEIALYTGNDDNIVSDLMTTYRFLVDGQIVEKQFSGGLLGHWAVWTKKAVQLLEEIKEIRKHKDLNPQLDKLLSKGVEITDVNAAIFDAANQFRGCIPGIHEILRRQGILEGRWCLNPEEELSPGQLEEIDRIYKEYPHLNDDEFVQQNLSRWLAERK